MALNVNTYSEGGSGKDFGPPQAGNRLARLVYAVEIGVQDTEYQGQVKTPRAKAVLGFELVDNADPIEINGALRPRWLSKQVTLTRNEKGTLPKILGALDPAGQYKGDIAAMTRAGLPCLILLAQDGDRVAISQIGPIPPGYQVPPLQNQPLVFDWDSPDQTIFSKSIPNWIRESIKVAHNFKGSAVERLFNQQDQQQVAAQPAPVAQGPVPGLPPAQAAPAPAPVHQPFSQPLGAPSAPPGWAFVNGQWVPENVPHAAQQVSVGGAVPAPVTGGPTPY
jgi:hypothetical protein